MVLIIRFLKLDTDNSHTKLSFILIPGDQWNILSLSTL